MPKKIDTDRIIAMAENGVREGLIAQRLRVHLDTVRSTLKESAFQVNPGIGRPSEDELLSNLHAEGTSYRKLGYQFGLSHEAVRKRIECWREEQVTPLTVPVVMSSEEGLSEVPESVLERARRRHLMLSVGKIQAAATLYLIKRDGDFRALGFESITAYAESVGVSKQSCSRQCQTFARIDELMQRNGSSVEELIQGEFKSDLLRVVGITKLYQLREAPDQMEQLLLSGKMELSDGTEVTAEEAAALPGAEFKDELDRLRAKDRLTAEHLNAAAAKAERLEAEKKALQKQVDSLEQKEAHFKDLQTAFGDQSAELDEAEARLDEISRLTTQLRLVYGGLPTQLEMPKVLERKTRATLVTLINLVASMQGDFLETVEVEIPTLLMPV